MNLLKPLAIVATREQLPTVQASPTLDELVARFHAAGGSRAEGVRMSVAAQVERGQVLELMQQQIKATVGAGYWTDWVKLNCGVTPRQVRRYVQRWREFCKLNQKLGSERTSMSILAQGDFRRLDQDQ